MEKLTERLREIYGNRKWVIAVGPAVGAGGIHKMLSEWGSETLVVAGNPGTGDLPETEIVYTDARGDSILGGIRNFFASVEEPSQEVQTAVAGELDPDRVGVGGPFGSVVAASLNLASQQWDLELPELVAAPNLVT